jgi:hypothetical protein
MGYSDIIRITLIANNGSKYFEGSAPINDKNKVRALILLIKDKGVNIKSNKDDEQLREWF